MLLQYCALVILLIFFNGFFSNNIVFIISSFIYFGMTTKAVYVNSAVFILSNIILNQDKTGASSTNTFLIYDFFTLNSLL